MVEGNLAESLFTSVLQAVEITSETQSEINKKGLKVTKPSARNKSNTIKNGRFSALLETAVFQFHCKLPCKYL